MKRFAWSKKMEGKKGEEWAGKRALKRVKNKTCRNHRREFLGENRKLEEKNRENEECLEKYLWRFSLEIEPEMRTMMN